MNDTRLLLCTDMDRTVIPNGVQAEHPQARQRFNAFCQHPNVTLVYVTGRHQSLVKKAIKHYCLPQPDFVISDVGTRIYDTKTENWQAMGIWEEEIDKDWKPYDHAQLEALFSDIQDLRLQERSKQNSHKLSYYVPIISRHQEVLSIMRERLDAKNIKASLVWSIDEPKGMGLLDVLPLNATKLHAIEFLQNRLKFSLEEIVFAGDSGNDLPVLASKIPSVLVANATKEVKKSALKLAEQNGYSSALFIATGKNTDMNGNYAAGLLEGVGHYQPVLRSQLPYYKT